MTLLLILTFFFKKNTFLKINIHFSKNTVVYFICFKNNTSSMVYKMLLRFRLICNIIFRGHIKYT